MVHFLHPVHLNALDTKGKSARSNRADLPYCQTVKQPARSLRARSDLQFDRSEFKHFQCDPTEPMNGGFLRLYGGFLRFYGASAEL